MHPQRGRAEAATPSRVDPAAATVRVDAWLWAVRLYKTRSAATAACRGGHVRVNRANAKASTTVKIGDRVDAFADRQRVLVVIRLVDKRVGAPIASACFIDQSPPQPVVKRQAPAPRREQGMGRPTKRERRQLDRVTRSRASEG